MLYELLILFTLMRGPAHGYLIAKIINDMIGPYATFSHGRLYPLLARLEQQGLIQVEQSGSLQQGDRQTRVYRITEAGRERFHRLMMDTTSNLGEYREIFAHKVAGFGFLTPAERLQLIEHYIGYCKEHIQHIYSEAEDLLRKANDNEALRSPEQLEHILNVMHHWIEQWKLELCWAKRLRESVLQSQARQEEAVAAGGQNQAVESN
ncbi:PadR family transcriptional regulator [Thermogemmatispora sp.]|uniref:PadR family transcriptional regulator n=1 Tax=Thermogemmatispora sp. TaxID=1968838 RepID=UPI001D47D020|nr:PadR family transcriptional regulator [Thermogemmatispora sp.]MBX5451398.1 PadR family transcriptional regulator [Thermogemmatispora sp.]